MLYKKSKSENLDEELFRNPGKEFRGAPFWAWNCRLNREELLWQTDRLKEMGFGGFFIHSRSGMSTEYLGKEFMQLVAACNEHAKNIGMLTYLYDEDRWASGAAGGYVTENKKYRIKFLEFTAGDFETFFAERSREERDPVYIVSFDVMLDPNGYLQEYRRINLHDRAKGVKWNVFRTLGKPDGWFNGYTYIDAMCEEAVDKFIKCTYEAYKLVVGKDFGGAIPAIFTDEPHVGNGREGPIFASDALPFSFAWTDDFPNTFRNRYGYDILDRLPEVVWDFADKPNTARYHFRNHVCERFVKAFSEKIGKWCKKNGIAFTGHLLNEPSLTSQTFSVGETMRHYGHFELPGIDVLCNFVELSTAKQCQSVVHQYGKEGMTSELYGVTGWDFDFRGHKFQGDWQAALGVTLRVPHLSWVSMKGAAKRDYPASINYHSSWYKQYPLIEDHFARLNTVLTRGKPMVKLGVIHPVESFWLKAGPSDTSSEECRQMEERFSSLINWLLRGNLDFDFIAESALPELYRTTDKGFTVGKINYSAVLIPPVETLRSTTIDALMKFAEKGGKVVFAGKCPELTDGIVSEKAVKLFEIAGKTEFSRADILKAFADERDVEILGVTGTNTDNLIYSLRQDGVARWLFIARCVMPVRFEGGESRPQNLKIILKGSYKPVHYDTVSGKISQLPFSVIGNKTIFNYALEASESLLLKLIPTKESGYIASVNEKKRCVQILDFPDNVQYILNEPNVLLLDICKYSWDKKTWFGEEEVLRIDSIIRKQLGYPPANGKGVQPWKIKDTVPDKYLYLKFDFESEVDAECRIAFEEVKEIVFNGEAVTVQEDGYFTDKSIHTARMPNIKKGKNELIVYVPVGKRVGLENMFLLGNFGILVEGRKAKVVACHDKIAFGSITGQGLPFYGAEITYILPFECEGGDLQVVADYFNGAVIGVQLDGEDVGKIAFAPYTVEIPDVEKGKHTLKLTLYATRVNTFGALHDCTDRLWKGANMWFTEGAEWSYEYNLKPVGIMKSPVLKVYK